MNWGEVIFLLLGLAGVYVLRVVIMVLKSQKQPVDKKTPPGNVVEPGDSHQDAVPRFGRDK
jgi:hypothetical protein